MKKYWVLIVLLASCGKQHTYLIESNKWGSKACEAISLSNHYFSLNPIKCDSLWKVWERYNDSEKKYYNLYLDERYKEMEENLKQP